MHGRAFFSRVVVAIGAVATIATSAPEDFEISAEAFVDVSLPEVRRLTVAANESANVADSVKLEIDVDSTRQTYVVVPDDPSFDIVEGSGAETLDIEEMCPPSGACELGFSIDADGEGPATLSAFVTFRRAGDPSFFFPESRDFDDSASVELFFDEQ